MASKAFPALVLVALVCGQLVVDGHAQPYTGGGRIRGGGSADGVQPPTYTTTHGHSSTIGNLSIAENTTVLQGLQPWKKTRPSWSTACRRTTARFLSRLPATSPSRSRQCSRA
ncbi:uncharacterized protein [Triticum aestivum]|uniref:uncharacterized protein isoform X1 n=1 Tax=Triticum aestivum TaxID=4565 RepID=UPI001D03028A|nr:uncharacterized protein LOC123134939 isoform X1 [Triticum aestivum]